MSAPPFPNSNTDGDDLASSAGLKRAWQAILDRRFGGEELFAFWRTLGPHFDEGTLVHEIARVAAEEAKSADRRPPLILAQVEDWRTTTRIDGILPLTIPLASDITTVARRFGQAVEALSFPQVPAAALDRLQDEWSVCLLAWFHERPLRVDFELEIELRAACPRSAISARKELSLMATMPNGSRITVFYSRLPGSAWLTLPEAAVEHVERLEAIREGESGDLRLAKKA